MRATRAGTFLTLSVITVVGGLSACNEPPPGDNWSLFAVDAQEVDPPMSFDDLQKEAVSIVVGRAVDLANVPPEVSGLPRDAAVVAVTFEVTTSVRGAGESEIRIVRPRQPADSMEDLRASLPTEQVLLFAEPAGYGGYWALTSDLGALAQREQSVVAVFDEPLSPNVVPDGVRTLDQLIQLTR